MFGRKKGRICPVDGATLLDLQVETRDGPVRVDRCPECRGHHLDRSELDDVLGESGYEVRLAVSARKGGRGKHKCAECRTLMEVATEGKLHIDVCPACSGMWLDASELDVLHRAAKSAGDREAGADLGLITWLSAVVGKADEQ